MKATKKGSAVERGVKKVIMKVRRNVEKFESDTDEEVVSQDKI